MAKFVPTCYGDFFCTLQNKVCIMLTNHRTQEPVSNVNQECAQNKSKAVVLKTIMTLLWADPPVPKLLLEEFVVFAHPRAVEGPVSQPCSDSIRPSGTASPCQLSCTCAFLTMLFSARLPYPISFCSPLIRLPNNALFLHSEITNQNNKLVAIKTHVPDSLPAKTVSAIQMIGSSAHRSS